VQSKTHLKLQGSLVVLPALLSRLNLVDPPRLALAAFTNIVM